MIVKTLVIRSLSKEWNTLRATDRCVIERQAALVRIEATLSVCRLSFIERLVASGALS